MDVTDSPAEIPPPMELPEQVRLLEANARALIEAGNHADAERLFTQLLEVAPHHVPALQYLAGQALARNQLEVAQQLLERAIRIAPRRAELHQNLGIVLQARGYPQGALVAFDHALKYHPRLAVTWVQRGDVLQFLERHHDAIASYRQAEILVGNLMRFAALNPPRIQQIIERAAGFLHSERLAILDTALAPLRRRHEPPALEHAEQALAHMIHAAQPEYTDPLQQPAFGYFPGLEARPFYPRERFPRLSDLERKTPRIRAELERVLTAPGALKPYVEIATGNAAQWTELNHSPKWSAYHLYWNGVPVPGHREECPDTIAAMDSLPLVRIPGHAPEIFFSILAPQTHIPPHHGLANYKLAVHLPLVIPPHCAIRVGDETREWAPGECLVFDDSFEHEAWNRGNTPRAVLIFEVWHPDLTPVERKFLATAIAALNQFNHQYAVAAAHEPNPGKPAQT